MPAGNQVAAVWLAICLAVGAAASLRTPSPSWNRTRVGWGGNRKAATKIGYNSSGHVISHEVHVQLTQSKLADFTHRGGLHVDRVELRSEANDRNAFFVNNPTDPSYPLWAAPRPSVAQVWPRPRKETRREGGQHQLLQARQRPVALRIARQLRMRLLGAAQTDDLCQLAAARFARRAFADVAAISDSLADAEAVTAPVETTQKAEARRETGVDSLEISVRNTTFLQYPHLDMREDCEACRSMR